MIDSATLAEVEVVAVARRQGVIRGIRECLAIAECLADPEHGSATSIVTALREKLARAEAEVTP